jgi:citrate synthase
VARKPIRSDLGWSTVDRIVVRGKDLPGEILGNAEPGRYGLFRADRNGARRKRVALFNAMAVTLVEHGITPSALAARLTFLGAPEAMQAAVAAGLSGLGSVFVGSMEGAAKMLSWQERAARSLSGSQQAHLRARPPSAQADRSARRSPVRDRARNRLLRQALRAHGERSARKKGMVVNATGAIGALACELGLDWRAVRGIGVMARAVGLVGPPAGGVAPADGRGDLASGRRRGHQAHPQDMNLARDNIPELRDAVRQLCSQFDSAYWQKIDEQRAYPEAFVEALTKAGWMSALIPRSTAAPACRSPKRPVIMEEVTRSGGNAGCCHGQMYNMNTPAAPRLAAAEAKSTCRRSPPASCACSRWASPSPARAPTPPKIKTVAVKKGDRYVVNGQKVWTSRLQHSELMILLTRTRRRTRSRARPTACRSSSLTPAARASRRARSATW